jgi:NAD(P)-dependent dehydrogenase (short-subunit alcohol dehydrogenase family)
VLRLHDKVAVVTGGSSGLGLATAQRFARERAFVYITGRGQDELDMAIALIGDRATAVRGDVQNVSLAVSPDISVFRRAILSAPTRCGGT